MEYTNFYNSFHGNKTTFYNWFDQNKFPYHNLYHPYAFVGIPGLSPGMAFEIMRPNQGYYKSLANQPYAELRIILRFSSLLGMYTFDAQHQHHIGNKFKNIDFDSIYYNVDFSLRATIAQIIQADLNTTFNFANSIYLINMADVFYSNTTLGNNTES